METLFLIRKATHFSNTRNNKTIKIYNKEINKMLENH